MTLYHFTSRRFVASILLNGLRNGAILQVIRDDPRGRDGLRRIMPRKGDLRYGYQWLTSDPEPAAQEWAEGTGTLPYLRTEVRLTVEVPEGHVSLYRWRDMASHLSPVHARLSAYGRPEDWWVFAGTIPAAWIREVRVFVPADMRAAVEAAVEAMP